MNDARTRIFEWFWRLVPANPILVRVVQGGSRRVRHLWLRAGYLAALIFVVLLVMVGGSGSASTLSDLAKNASKMFMWASITQLALMCFLAPVFTAGAITQERDAQTFNILLSTPLSNAQIVLGSLMSRLFFVLVLLLGGLPIFLMTMVYGGVTFDQIMQSFAIAGATAIITGSLAISISMIRVGTRRTIFSFFLMIGLYLLAVYALGKWDRTWIPEAPANTNGERVSWLAPIHPFLALDVALNRVPAPDPATLTGRGAIARFCASQPHTAYVIITLTASFLLTVLAAVFVRRPKDNEVGIFGRLKNRILKHEPGERRRKPRKVWRNPIAWREAVTRASAAARGFLQIVLLGGGVVTAIGLLIFYIDSQDVAAARTWLAVVIMIELGLILLVATNTAATAMTKEKESLTLELLMTTPLTSRDIVWGKLRGLITFTVPMIGIPTFTVLLFGFHGLIVGADDPVVPIEAGFLAAALMFSYSSAACMLGLHVSLHSRKTVQAVMVGVGIGIGTCLILTFVVDSITSAADQFGASIAPFSPFTALSTLVNPVRLFDSPQRLADSRHGLRVWSLIGSSIAILVYMAGVAWTYKSMVRNFDMTLRKQSARV